MKPQIHFQPQAQDEALRASQWYEERRAGLGAEFTEALTEVVSRIAENPLAFPKIRGEFRRSVCRRFPYAVYFRTQGDDIVILSVHGRQDPSRWQVRT